MIPGDEKAQPEAPGAPTPLKAAEIVKDSAPKTQAPPPTPKTTAKKSQTGAGEPANREAAKTSAGKPRTRKAAPRKPKGNS